MAVPRPRGEAWTVHCRGGKPCRSRPLSHLQEEVRGGRSALSAPPSHSGRGDKGSLGREASPQIPAQALEGQADLPWGLVQPLLLSLHPRVPLLFLCDPGLTKSLTHKNRICTRSFLKGKEKVKRPANRWLFENKFLTERCHSLARDAGAKGGVLWRRRTFLVFVIFLQPTHPHLNSSAMEAEEGHVVLDWDVSS